MKDHKKMLLAVNLKALAARMFYNSEMIKENYGKDSVNAIDLADAGEVVKTWADGILKEIKTDG
jgi:hypothetical protein